MANKSVTVTEPVANDAGNVIKLAGHLTLSTDAAGAAFDGSFNMDVDNLNATTTDAITDLVTEVLAQYKTDHGF